VENAEPNNARPAARQSLIVFLSKSPVHPKIQRTLKKNLYEDDSAVWDFCDDSL